MLKIEKPNGKLSVEVYEEFKELIERKTCYSNCVSVLTDNKENGSKSLKGKNIIGALGYCDSINKGYFIRHSYLIDADTGEVIDPTMPVYGHTAEEIDKMIYYTFKTLTLEEWLENERSQKTLGYFLTQEEYNFLKPFYIDICRNNVEDQIRTLREYGTLLTLTSEELASYGGLLFKTKGIKENIEKFFEEAAFKTPNIKRRGKEIRKEIKHRYSDEDIKESEDMKLEDFFV